MTFIFGKSKHYLIWVKIAPIQHYTLPQTIR